MPNYTMTNKFLGSEHPRLTEFNFHGKPRRGSRNENGHSGLGRVLLSQAKADVIKKLAEVIERRDGRA